MANYTERDLNDILVEYVADRAKKMDELKERTSTAKSTIDLATIAGETFSLCHRIAMVCSIIVDLSADEYFTKLASEVLDDLRQLSNGMGVDFDNL